MPEMRWDPFRDLIAIQDRMNRLFETALSRPDFGGESSGIGTWAPTCDVVETAEAIEVSCELAGLEREQIDIRLEDNVLTISGDRRIDRESDAEQYHRIERAYGPFRRHFNLPVGVDPYKIEARYEHGVLRVILPKRPESAPRKITVRVS